MTIETTERTHQASQLVPMAEALLALASTFGHLPVPYVTITRSEPELGLLTDAVGDFELWRAALLIAPDAVELVNSGPNSWLAVDGFAHGAPVHLTCHSIALPIEADEDAQGAV
jgi:hypothetical protein